MTDARRIIPPGIKFDFLAVAFHKYMLETVALSPQERLEVLEALNSYATGGLSKAVTAAILPCTSATAKMICEALDLPPQHQWQKFSEGYAILTRSPVFGRPIDLHPSLVTAVCLWCG